MYGQSYREGVCPRITIVVVGKRHHTRFYRSDINGKVDQSDRGKRGNPPFGTVCFSSPIVGVVIISS